ncbi:YdeI/OmpD-associated family protein [Kineococcus rhizosphaerae]|uniref:Bacteriocin resistance YdeI/OmpD-like protein n=1 Tax=Kineococcus rhizosphaerae TaxID=559628 RepID=A0A2T0R103_9ACTN|nr:YdeI/OmpD-associated family protein [Kineococcus rhizosphaerae]PRY13002.1 bacteriocin resistance YdeI/OmpD-like protein [Kineococcus rhizosphaerae]
MPVEFTATLELHRTTATGLEVPAEVLEQLGGGRRPAVTVTFAGYSFRTTVGSMGGRALIPVTAQVRAASGVAAGDVLDVVLELDTAPRVVEVPADLAAALEAAGLRAAFDALAPSQRKAHVTAVEGAKAEATRVRRVEKVVAALSA